MPKKRVVLQALSPSLYSCQRIMSEATKLGFEVQHINPYTFHLALFPQAKKTSFQEGLFLHRTTGIHYDDFDLTVTKHHEMQGLKVSNPLAALKTFRTKDWQMLFFKEHALPSIPTLLHRGPLSPSLERDLSRLSPKGPYILKMSRGNQGIGVNFLESKRSLLSLLETFCALKDQRFMIQPHIPHSREWRLFMIKGEIIACIEKKLAKEDFRGNAKRARACHQKKVPTPLAELASRAFFQSGLDYAGLDVLESPKGELLLLEINAIPGFEQVETLSKHNIARELLLQLH